MNSIVRRSRCALPLALIPIFVGSVAAQTTLNLRAQSRNVDFSAAEYTRPFRAGTVLPPSCIVGEMFFKTDAAAGNNVYACVMTGAWSLVGSSAFIANRPVSAAAPATGDILKWTGTEWGLANELTGISGRKGTGSQLLTFGGGDTAAGHCAAFDSGGNVVSSGAPCGSGTTQTPVAAGTDGQLQIKSGTGFAGRTVGPGLADDGIAIKINPAAVKTYLSGTASLTHGTIAAAACSSRTIDVPGAALNDPISLGAPADILTFNLQVQVAVSAPNTVTVRLCNNTAGAVTPTPAMPWSVVVWRSF